MPKLALVAIKIYFRVLVKVLLASSIPFANTFKSFSNNTKCAASLTISVAVSTEILASAAWSAGVSFIPLPIYPNKNKSKS